jgi:hypothetical protein
MLESLLAHQSSSFINLENNNPIIFLILRLMPKILCYLNYKL